MNKKILAVVLALGVLGTSNAFASRARVLTMGDGFGSGFSTGFDGSFYYDDTHNMFYNPAYVNDFKNWATVEKSAGSSGQAQGGFATSMHGFNLGMYFNRHTDTSGLGSAGTGYLNSSNMRPIDVIFGGEQGNLKWGVGANYSSFKGANDTSDTDLVVKLGVSVMDFEPFLAWRAIGIDNLNAVMGRNKMFALGLRYHWGEWTPVAYYKNSKFETAGIDTKGTRDFGLGLGRNMKLAEGFRLNYMASLFRRTADVVSASNITGVPLTMGMEGDVTSWMTARGGFTYFLLARQNGQTLAIATTGRIGATFHLGKADLDWVWGNGAAGATGTSGTEANSNIDAQVMDLNGIFTAASLTYRW